jgi:hypothetical protein
MPRLLRIVVLLAGSLALVSLALACRDGGNGDDDKRTPTATPAATATEEPADGVTPSDGPAGASPFESYHYTVDLEFTVEGEGAEEGGTISGTVEGDFVAPASHSFRTTFDIGGLSGTEEAVIIGDQAWYRGSGEQWHETTLDDPDVISAIELTSADPGFLSAGDLGEDLAALDSEIEERNGVSTRRYHIPREAVDALIQLFGDEFLQDASGLQDFEMTVWLEEESGALVRAEFSATASPEIFGDETSGFDLPPDATLIVSMVIDLTQINDAGISIEPPV